MRAITAVAPDAFVTPPPCSTLWAYVLDLYSDDSDECWQWRLRIAKRLWGS